MGSGGKDKEPRQKKKPGRVPTSCKECRRLKLRCDRNVPCEKCVSRGCGSICPDGVLTPGRGGRLYLADTEELYERIEQISMRNKDLENALRRLQETVSDQPHPLLSAQDGVLQLNIIPQSSSSSGPSTSSSSKSPSASRISPTIHHPPPEPMELDISLDEDSNVIDAFGTLAMSKRGEYAFYGKTALPEYLAQAANKPHRLPRPSLPRLTKRIMEVSFPESDLLHNQSLLSEVLDLLPPHDEALHLCEVYLEYGKFLYSPVSRKELFDETLSVIYRAKQFGAFEHYSTLSLLYVVFAIAALFSPNKQPYAVEALEYYYLSKTAMGFTQPFQDTSLTSIQVHVHMAQFLDLSDLEPGGLEAAWMYTGNAMRLGMKIGLHMNSSRWKLLPQEASQRRHALFWRLFVSDTWTSLHHGRPPGISRGHFDCPIPSYPNPTTTTTGASPRFDSSETDPPDFHEWNVGFTLLLHSVLEASFGPKQPVYSAILDFDRKIRDFYVPPQWRTPSEEESVAPPPEVAMYRWLVLSAKEIVLLNLHRAYFAQALQDSPLSVDLQQHPYLPSIVAIFRSSWRLIRGLAMTWMVIPKFLARVNLAWSHGVSAAIVMCLFVTRAPTLHMTTAALEELDNLTSLFDSSSSSCRPAAKFLTSIQALCRKAHESIGLPHGHGRFHQQHHQHDDELSVSLPELDRLNGKTSYLYPEHTHTSSAFEPAPSGTSGTNTDPRSRATSVTISDIAESHHPVASSSSTSSYHHQHHHQHHQSASIGQENHLHPTIIQDLREFALGSSAMSGSSSSGSGSGSRPHMSFSDYPSDPIMHSELVTTPNSSHSIPGSTPPPPPPSQPSREREQRDRDRADTPPDTARLLQQTFSPGPQPQPQSSLPRHGADQHHPFHPSSSSSSSSSSAYLSSSYFGSGGPSTTASYPHLYPQEPYMTAGMDPRKLMMFAPGPPPLQPTPLQPQFPPSHLALAMHVQSGFTGGFGASPIALDSSWNSFVEQLGF